VGDLQETALFARNRECVPKPMTQQGFQPIAQHPNGTPGEIRAFASLRSYDLLPLRSQIALRVEDRSKFKK
jgi:hypothetical protein